MIRRYAASAALVAILIAGPASAQTDRAADKAAAEKIVREQATTFLTNDDKKAASYFYVPWMQIGTGKTLNSAEEAEKFFAEFKKSLPKEYDHLTIKQLSAKMLGKDFAMVSYVGERQTKDNKVLATVASSFFVKRTDAGWKIAAGITYPAEDYIKLD
jgi:hypothetical protein